jgi:integrase
MAVRIEIHDRNIAVRRTRIKDWKIPRQEQRCLERFLDELELGRVNKGRKISESRQLKYLDLLKVPLEHFSKSAPRITLKDVERFEKALSTGFILSRNGQPYAHATKVDFRRALQVYLRWRLGAARADPLVDWLDTRDVAKTPDFVREADIEKLFKACKSAAERFLIAMLFDTGARATEFHNIRYEDVQIPQDTQNYVRITLKEEYSKTKGRTISLFWKHTTEAVKDYIAERVRNGIRSDEPVFEQSYEASRFFLLRLGKKVLGRSLHYHLFRHSSATYYADKMNRQQLCIRYGWAFSSRMPDVYIARAGVDTQELDARFAAGEIEKFKSNLTRMEQESKIKAERIALLESTVAVMQKQFPLITQIVQEHGSVSELRKAIAEKQKQKT